MALKALFLDLLSNLFAFVSWPSFALLYPLYASFRTMESQSHSKNQQCLAFWVLFALFAMLEHTFAKFLVWLHFWPYMKGMVTFILVMRYFGGASYVYKYIVRPNLSKGPYLLYLLCNIMFVVIRKCLLLCGHFLKRNCFASKMRDNFIDVKDKDVIVDGQEGFEKNIACEEKFLPNCNNIEGDFKLVISDKVQKEWSCALCLISTSNEECFKGHLKGKKHKAKEEELRAEELALNSTYESSYIANRKNGMVFLENLVGLEKWSGLIPVAGSIRCCWKKPEVGWVKLNTDGSIDRKNASMGGLLRDYKGDAICAFVSKAPLDDIFLVELCAIWRGLVLALGLGVKVVWVESDSRSGVRTINRKQSHNGKADNCLKHIWALLKKFDEYQVTHSWRETNKAADYLSKMISNKNDVVLWPVDFPQSLQNIIQDDARGRIYLRR